MKRLVLAITVLMLATTRAYAQQPAPPADATRPGPGGMSMMEMCREMMAGHGMGRMMGGGMMAPGMMGPGMMGGDPRMMGHMLEMRGEMMKAMGEIMLKHAQKLQQLSPPPK